MEAVFAHQQQVVGVLEEEGLLGFHPDRPDASVFRSVGVAAFMQGGCPSFRRTRTNPSSSAQASTGSASSPRRST